jgi:hypothetical protein
MGIALTTAVAGAAMAGTADAATIGIAPAKPCYLSGETITAQGAGFTAGGPVDVKIDGTSLGQIGADASGAIGAVIKLGTMRGAKSHALTATDLTNPSVLATASFLGTTNTVSVKPKQASAGKPRRLKGYGFFAGPNVYMHVRGHGYKADRRIAKPEAPCGTFVVRKRIVPAGSTPGRYRVQFDARRRYTKKTRPEVHGTLRVFRRARSSSARAAVMQRWSRLPH